MASLAIKSRKLTPNLDGEENIAKKKTGNQVMEEEEKASYVANIQTSRTNHLIVYTGFDTAMSAADLGSHTV